MEQIEQFMPGLLRLRDEMARDGEVVEQVVFYDSENNEIQASALAMGGQDPSDQEVAPTFHEGGPEGTAWSMIVRAPGQWGGSRALFVTTGNIMRVNLDEYEMTVTPLMDGVPQEMQEDILEEATQDPSSTSQDISVDEKTQKLTPEDVTRVLGDAIKRAREQE